MSYFQILLKFASPIRVHPKDYFWNIFEALLISLYMISSLEITKRIIIAIHGENHTTFYGLLIALGIISLGTTFVRISLHKQGWAPIMHNGISIYLEKYMQKFVSAEGNAVERIGTGKFITILDKGLHDWFDMLFKFSYEGLINIIFIGYALFTIFSLSFFAGLTSIGLFVLALLVAIFVNFIMRDYRNIRRDSFKEALHTTTILFMSRNEVLQNNSLFSVLIKKAQGYLEDAKNAHHKVAFWFVIMEEFPKSMVVLIRIGIYIYLANMIWVNGGSFAELAIFITIISIAEKSLNEFVNLVRDAIRLFSFIELFWKTFEELPTMKGYDTGNSFTPKNKHIEIKNISYGYNESKVFSDFSLTIEKGKKTALVGASGGGKTTLMKLIAGYLHPESGHISVMGNKLDETALKSYYPHIGYLTQDPGVFDATIRENLVSAIAEKKTDTHTDTQRNHSIVPETKNKVTTVSSVTVSVSPDEMLQRALKLAQCDFVFEMEKGLDTEIGERGVRLSGGQKQRLAIAKIFLKNPEIILLDEPTSALDSFSEEKITEALDELFRGRTVIIIAHRLQTVKKSNDIIVIEGGEVVERGDHSTLVAKKGIYHKMLELQSGF